MGALEATRTHPSRSATEGRQSPYWGGRACDRGGHATWLALFAGHAFAFEAGLEEVLAVAFLAEGFAAGFDAEGVFDGAEAEAASDAVIEDVDAVVLEFDDFAAVDADEVVVGGAIEEIGVVGGLTVAEVDFLEEAGLGEEGEGAVEGGAGGPGGLSTEAFPELVGRKMLIGGENGLDEGVALGGVAEAFVFDKGVQSFAHLGGHGEEYKQESRLLNIELCLRARNW